jgi:hypothetical protein
MLIRVFPLPQWGHNIKTDTAHPQSAQAMLDTA